MSSTHQSIDQRRYEFRSDKETSFSSGRLHYLLTVQREHINNGREPFLKCTLLEKQGIYSGTSDKGPSEIGTKDTCCGTMPIL